jgi:endonuclease III
LSEFADNFLGGNRGIIAHVLWYIRKRYCNRPPKCNECELSKYCKRAFSFSS